MRRLVMVGEVVPEIEAAVCHGLDQLLRATGAVQPPMVHMFSDVCDPPYLGCCATARPGDPTVGD